MLSVPILLIKYIAELHDGQADEEGEKAHSEKVLEVDRMEDPGMATSSNRRKNSVEIPLG